MVLLVVATALVLGLVDHAALVDVEVHAPVLTEGVLQDQLCRSAGVTLCSVGSVTPKPA
jgi:hypothetical protein